MSVVMADTIVTANNRTIRTHQVEGRFYTREMLWAGLRFDYHGTTHEVTSVSFSRNGIYVSTARPIESDTP